MFRFTDEDDDAGFAIVPDQSFVMATVRADAPDNVLWTIAIEWHNPDIDEPSFRDANIEITNISFGPGDCRSLKGREARAVYSSDDVHPILPDNPGNFYYCSEHHVPNHNHIRISDANGADLDLHWQCVAETLGPPGVPLEIKETVTFRKLVVEFANKRNPTVDEALAIAVKFLDKAQLGEAEAHGNQIEFPVRMQRTASPRRAVKKKATKAGPDEPAVKALRKFGAKVKRDKTRADNPVVGVEFAGDTEAEAIRLLPALPSLVQVSLHGAGITDASLAPLKDLPNIKTLSIGGQPRITDAGLEHLRGLSALEDFHLDNATAITDRGLELLSSLPRLHLLDLYGGQYTDAGAAHLEKLTDMRRLTLCGSKIGDAGLKYLCAMTHLAYLNIDGTEVTDAGIGILEALKELSHLNSNGTSLTDAALEVLGGWPQLRRLGLSETKITDAGLLHLHKLTKLEFLYLTKTKITKAGADTLKGFARRAMIML